MMKNLTIRKPTHEDTVQLEILFQLIRRKTFTSRPENEFQIGDYQKSTADDEVWVAEQNGAIVGFVSTYPANNFLHNLFVHPGSQGQGIGTQLLQVAEANLARPMTLKIAMDNLAACRFYEKYGWYQVSVHEDVREPYILYGKD